MIQRFTIRVKKAHWDLEKHISVVDSDQNEIVEITVDLEGIAKRYGPKAARSKGGKAVEAGGLVQIKHIR